MADRIYTFDDFKNAREKFVLDQDKNKKEKKRKSKLDEEGSLTKDIGLEITDENFNNNVIYMAVKWGYEDARRTMSGIGNLTAERESALKNIAKEIQKYLKKEKSHQDKKDFDSTHVEICNKWVDDDDLKKVDGITTYGKAQKIVNMAFKYLYCCEDAYKYEEYFKFCHVPLDSITLEWFYRKRKGEDDDLTRDSMLAWSKIESYRSIVDKEACMNEAHKKDGHSYMYFQNYFREWFGGQDKITPLQAEFIYWPLTQETLAAEAFLKSLTDEGDNLIGKPISDDNKKAIYDKIAGILNPAIENEHE